MGAVRLDSVRAAEATGSKAGTTVDVRKNVCTHCSVGCTVIAEVENGVWNRQQPGWDSPINRGTHCAKGAAIREVVHSARRLRYPLKLEGGEWKRISWDQAINEISDKMLAIRENAGADSGSSAPSGALIRSTTKRASVIRPRSQASPTPGATARKPIPTTICAMPRP
jgi:formate dehydrogenase major subunit